MKDKIGGKWLPQSKCENNNKIVESNCRFSIHGPSFPGKTYLLMEKAKVKNNRRYTFTITGCPEQY